MNIEIIIPTLGRCDNQVTLANLPKWILQKTTLVVQQHEYEKMLHLYGNKCNVWELPPGTQGIAQTRKLIANKWKGKNIFIMDDDLSFNVALPKPDGTFERREPTDDEWQALFFDIIKLMVQEGIVHGGLAASNVPPVCEPVSYNGRIWTNVFYSSRFNPDDVDFGEEYVLMPEDFYVNLQLLTKGYKNAMINWFRVSPSATNSEGGCETFRTLENHNAGQIILQQKFPDFVKIREKVQKSGPWKDKTKLALTIYWKKAYNSSQYATLF